MKLKPLALAIIATSVTQTSWAQNNTVLDKIYVNDGHIIDDELSTTYSTRQFTSEDIRNSGATSLAEFLSQNTSIIIKPSFGNPLSPRLDLGAFGAESGYENVQIILNGISLKNIDLVPAQLSAIDLNSVKNISIIKGSGSVLYGNGSAGGAIVIDTFNGNNIESGGRFTTKYTSDYRQANSISARHSEASGQLKYFGDFSLQTERSDGQIEVKADGSKNTLDHHTLATGFGVTNGASTADLQFTSSQSEVTYPGNLSLSDYRDDPDQDQTTGNTQDVDQKTSQLHLGHQFNKTKVDYTWKTVNKDAKIWSLYHYNQDIHQLDLKSRLHDMVISYGLKSDNNKRTQDDIEFVIDTRAIYSSIDYQPNIDWTFNAGLRLENVNYEYRDTGNKLDKTEKLEAYNLGANYKLNDQSALYANFNHAFNSPAIDRYFKWNSTFTSQEFNGFIDIQTSDTLTLGYKNQMDKTDITLEVFASKLENELFLDKYLDPFGFGINTSIDRSSKQGINLLLEHHFDNAKIGADYQYQNARIDRNDDTNLKGKKVPGVPEHSINLFAETAFIANWMPGLKDHRLNISHKAATESYALSDFKNEYGKFPTFHSTDLTYTMENKQLALKIGVNNLFNKANGTYVYKGNAPKGIVVYPENFERSWFIQADLKL